MKTKRCVFAGTFDPPTLGHKKIVEDCLKIFDGVIVAIMVNPEKTPAYTVEQRKEMLRLTFGENDKIEILEFSGTVAELIEQTGVEGYVRGIRNATDFDYETANYYATKRLNEKVLPLYIPCDQDLLHVSSSVVRSLIKFSKPLDGYVTEEVKAYLMNAKEKTE